MLHSSKQPRPTTQFQILRATLTFYHPDSEHRWYTLARLNEMTGIAEACVSAHLRAMRGQGWTVEKRRLGNGKFEYRLVGQ